VVLADLMLGCSGAAGSIAAPTAAEREVKAAASLSIAPAPTVTSPAATPTVADPAPPKPQLKQEPEPTTQPATISEQKDEIDELIKHLGGKAINREKSEQPDAVPSTAVSQQRDEIDELIKNLGGKSLNRRNADRPEPDADSGDNAVKKMVERLGGKYDAAKDESGNFALSISLADTAVSDTDLALLKHATNLVALDLSGTLITDAGIAHLKGLTGLLRLNLFATNVTGAGLVHLQGLKQLQELNLSFGFGTGGNVDSIVRAFGPKLDANSLRYIEGLKGLVELNLDDCTIGDEGLLHLARLTGLEKLHLSDTDISNNGLNQLKALKSLKELDISGNEEINNAGLVHLKPFSKLETLNVEGTKITAAALARFKQSMNVNSASAGAPVKSERKTPPGSGNAAPAANGSLPQYFDQLDLTEEQKDKVRKTAKQYDDQVATMKQKMAQAKGVPGGPSIVIAAANAIKKLNGDRQRALEEILTDEQRAKLRQLRSGN
jgi:hypothetical protein